MTKTPIQPIIFHGVVDLMMRDFSCDIDQAIRLTEKLILSLRTKDLDITRGNWMEQDPIIDERPGRGRGRTTWERMEAEGDEWETHLGGRKPWIEVQ